MSRFSKGTLKRCAFWSERNTPGVGDAQPSHEILSRYCWVSIFQKLCFRIEVTHYSTLYVWAERNELWSSIHQTDSSIHGFVTGFGLSPLVILFYKPIIMKDSIVYSQDPTAIKYELCSEKKCATCFENRGCMYEQYFTAPGFNLVTLLSQNQTKTQTQSINRWVETVSNGRLARGETVLIE